MLKTGRAGDPGSCCFCLLASQGAAAADAACCAGTCLNVTSSALLRLRVPFLSLTSPVTCSAALVWLCFHCRGYSVTYRATMAAMLLKSHTWVRSWNLMKRPPSTASVKELIWRSSTPASPPI